MKYLNAEVHKRDEMIRETVTDVTREYLKKYELGSDDENSGKDWDKFN